MPMKKVSTLLSTSPARDGMAASTEPAHRLASEAREAAGGPRKSTLDLIRRFARCYQFESVAGVPVGMILN